MVPGAFPLLLSTIGYLLLILAVELLLAGKINTRGLAFSLWQRGFCCFVVVVEYGRVLSVAVI